MDLTLIYTQLIRIENLDIWEGLVHVGCNKEVYADTLRLFCVDVTEKINNLTQLMEQENWKEYTAVVHAVKGGLAGIGAWELAKNARELEEAAKKGDYRFCREATGAALKKMKELNTALCSTAIFSDGTKPRERVSPDYMEKKLNELYWACFSGKSADADILVKELKNRTCGEEIDVIVDTIYTHVENLDYHLVLQLLAGQPYIGKSGEGP